MKTSPKAPISGEIPQVLADSEPEADHPASNSKLLHLHSLEAPPEGGEASEAEAAPRNGHETRQNHAKTGQNQHFHTGFAAILSIF